MNRSSGHAERDDHSGPDHSGYAPWRSAFVRSAEIDALIVTLLGATIGAAWTAVGYGLGVFALAAGGGLLIGAALVARQVVLDRYRDRAGRLEPYRPWWAR